MGKVAITYALMPEDTTFDFETLKGNLKGMFPSDVQLAKADIKPLAFGLQKLEVAFVIEDAEGLVDRIEDILRGIEGIQNVETENVSLL